MYPYACEFVLSKALALALAVLGGVPSAHCISLSIGGIDSSRGGYTSLANTSSTTGLRRAIETQFPGATFTVTNTLTSAYLATVWDVFISRATSDSATSSVTQPEQIARDDFVKRGGTALIFVDNDASSPGGPSANQQLTRVFGLHVTGTLQRFQPEAARPGGPEPVLKSRIPETNSERSK